MSLWIPTVLSPSTSFPVVSSAAQAVSLPRGEAEQSVQSTRRPSIAHWPRRNLLAHLVTNCFMRPAMLVARICACLVFTTKAFACFCFSPPMCSGVAALPSSSAVFVGRVVDVWPSRSILASETKGLSLDGLRGYILGPWRSSLSLEEERDVRTNVDRTAIELSAGAQPRGLKSGARTLQRLLSLASRGLKPGLMVRSLRGALPARGVRNRFQMSGRLERPKTEE